MPVSSYEKVVQCPYERSHVIVPDRLSVHLVKCRKNHPNSNVKICPYNSNHHIQAAKYDTHLDDCDSKDLAVHLLQESVAESRQNCSFASIDSGICSISPSPSNNTNSNNTDDEEDWEKDLIAEPYDPVKRSLEMNVIRKPRGLTPGQRREFVLQERIRLRAINEKEKAKNNPKLPVEAPVTIRRPMYVASAQTEKGKPESDGMTLRRPKFILDKKSTNAPDECLTRAIGNMKIDAIKKESQAPVGHPVSRTSWTKVKNNTEN
jgi:hypothetical protein